MIPLLDFYHFIEMWGVCVQDAEWLGFIIECLPQVWLKIRIEAY